MYNVHVHCILYIACTVTYTHAQSHKHRVQWLTFPLPIGLWVLSLKLGLLWALPVPAAVSAAEQEPPSWAGTVHHHSIARVWLTVAVYGKLPTRMTDCWLMIGASHCWLGRLRHLYNVHIITVLNLILRMEKNYFNFEKNVCFSGKGRQLLHT